jgi:hypothetical protein
MQADNRFCRNCEHHRDGHVIIALNKCFGGNDTGNAMCDCPEYIPEDNLEYLEYCVAKKEKLNEEPARR